MKEELTNSFDLSKLKVTYYGFGHNDEIESTFTYDGSSYHVNCYYSNYDGWDFYWRDEEGITIEQPAWFTKAIENDEFEYYEFAEIYLAEKE
jgi:hypothetical protein